MKQDSQIVTDECVLPIDPVPNDALSEEIETPETFDDLQPTQLVKVITEMAPEAEQATNVEYELGRGCRRRTPNSRYTKDYISPSISPLVKRVALSKRKASPASSTERVASKPPRPTSNKRKILNIVKSNSSKKTNSAGKSISTSATIGDVTISWPRYGIDKITINGRSLSITNTCPLDTGLFIYYHAYMAGSDKFRNIFQKGFLDIYSSLTQTIKLVNEENWDHARAYWLSKHNLLPKTTPTGIYDLTNTLTAVVFQFLQPIQEYTIRSECSCVACPRKCRETTSVDLVLTYV